MSKLSDLINAEDGFLVRLRCENTFDEEKYLDIKNEILIAQIAITSWTPRGKNLAHGWSRRIYP